MFDSIPYVTDLYSDNYSKQNIDNGTNHGLYTYWGDYYVNDKLFFNDIQIDEHDININSLNSFKGVQDYINEHNGKIFLFLGEGQHKIKRKAEQIACNEALTFLNLTTELV